MKHQQELSAPGDYSSWMPLLNAFSPGQSFSGLGESKNPTEGHNSIFDSPGPEGPATHRLTEIAYQGTQIARKSDRSVAGSKPSSRSDGRCAMYVSLALHQAGCHQPGKPEIRSGSAHNLGPSLAANGFRNLMAGGSLPSGRNLQSLPPGAVLVYSGGEHGHVEIRSKNGFISDYFSQYPVTGTSGAVSGRGRRLIGVWVKPSCGAGA